MAENDIPPCLIFIDKEGRWFHQGVEMINRGIIRLFFEHMEVDSEGRYIINWGGERCVVEVEDVPFVVRRTQLEPGDGKTESSLVLYLSDDSREDLSPDTLWIGENDVLYCRVKDRIFPARFDRPAYYQLAEHIREENGEYFLFLNGQKYPILRESHGP